MLCLDTFKGAFLFEKNYKVEFNNGIFPPKLFKMRKPNIPWKPEVVTARVKLQHSGC